MHNKKTFRLGSMDIFWNCTLCATECLSDSDIDGSCKISLKNLKPFKEKNNGKLKS